MLALFHTGNYFVKCSSLGKNFHLKIDYFVAMFTISHIRWRQKSNINFLGQRPLNYLLHISILRYFCPVFFLFMFNDIWCFILCFTAFVVCLCIREARE